MQDKSNSRKGFQDHQGRSELNILYKEVLYDKEFKKKNDEFSAYGSHGVRHAAGWQSDGMGESG